MPCALCGNLFLSTVSTVDAKSSEPLNVAMCHDCGLVQQDPIPSEAHLHHFYTHHYRTDYKRTYAPKPKHIYRAGLAAVDRAAFLERNGIRGGTLLDIGAGGGEFVYISNTRGYTSTGVEPNIGYSDFAKAQYGVDITTGDFGGLTQTFRIITMFHVLEHCPDPKDIFRTLWRLLDENGHLFIEVPNIEAADASPHNIFFQAHLFYFSRATLAACASPYFEPVVTDHRSNLRILFKRKSQATGIVLPSQEEIAHTLRRLHRKGWVEYLFVGGGIFKGLFKLHNVVRELRLRRDGKELLDTIQGLSSRWNA